MPHAALWVVQQWTPKVSSGQPLFQCRTRLCGWCSQSDDLTVVVDCKVSMPHAALWVMQHALFRPALCISLVSMPHAAIPFRPHHRFAVPLPRSRRGGLVRLRFLAESRNISFPRRCGGSGERSEPIGAPMPHAALRVAQRISRVTLCASVLFQFRTRLFPFAPTTASRSPSPAHAGEAFRLRHVSFSPRYTGRGLLQSPVAA